MWFFFLGGGRGLHVHLKYVHYTNTCFPVKRHLTIEKGENVPVAQKHKNLLFKQYEENIRNGSEDPTNPVEGHFLPLSPPLYLMEISIEKKWWQKEHTLISFFGNPVHVA